MSSGNVHNFPYPNRRCFSVDSYAYPMFGNNRFIVRDKNKFRNLCDRLKKPEVSQKQRNIMSATWLLSAVVLLALVPQRINSQGNAD